MKTEKVQNIYDALRIQFFWTQLVCMSSMKRVENNLVSSLGLSIYVLTYVLLYFVAVVVSIWLMWTEGQFRRQHENGYLWLIIGYFECIFTYVSYPVNMLYIHWKKTPQKKLLHDLYEIDEKLLKTFRNIELGYEVVYRDQMYATTISLTYFSLVLLQIVYSIFLLKLNTPAVLIFVGTYQIEQWCTGFLAYIYIQFVWIIKSKFILLKNIHHEIFELNNSAADANTIGRKVQIASLLNSFKNVCGVIALMNSTIGTLLIFRFAHDFTLATSQCYIIYWIIIDNPDSDKYGFICFVVIWMFQNVLKIGLTAYSTQLTVNEVFNSR